MKDTRRRPWRLVIRLCLLSIMIYGTYHSGYALGRKAGIADVTADSIAESIRSRFTAQQDKTTSSSQLDDPFGGDPFAEDPFAEDPFASGDSDPFNDPFTSTGPASAP